MRSFQWFKADLLAIANAQYIPALALYEPASKFTTYLQQTTICETTHDCKSATSRGNPEPNLTLMWCCLNTDSHFRNVSE